MERIIINNTALFNTGDAAIVVALHDALRKEGCAVFVATPHREFGIKHYPSLKYCSDVLGYVHGVAKIGPLSHLVSLMLLLRSKTYRSASIIIGAPGGYLNSFYTFSWKLTIYRWARRFGKRTAIFSQSVGPLSESDRKKLAASARHIDLLVARDACSFRAAVAAGVEKRQLLLSPDAIFLRAYNASKQSEFSRVVGISVREWRHDGRSEDVYVGLLRTLIDRVLCCGYEIEFVSTCQGVDGYTNDSILASQIVEKWYSEEKREGVVTVNTEFNPVEVLQKKLRTYNFVVGTRLHMCLLSLINGVPAFNISYELKGRECYQYLGFSNFTVDYNEEMGSAVKAFDGFLNERELMRDSLPHKVARANARVHYILKKTLRLCRDMN